MSIMHMLLVSEKWHDQWNASQFESFHMLRNFEIDQLALFALPTAMHQVQSEVLPLKRKEEQSKERFEDELVGLLGEISYTSSVHHS